MDCEKLDALATELVYGELDAQAAEEARLHLLGCPRCSAAVERLRGGLRAAEALPLEAPSSLLESRILAAADAARAPAPWHRRASRAVALAGVWAMRPQVAMAAVVVLMVGTSAVLLRRSSPTVAQRTKVTDDGTPVATLEQPAEGAPALVGARPGTGAPAPAQGRAAGEKAAQKSEGGEERNLEAPLAGAAAADESRGGTGAAVESLRRAGPLGAASASAADGGVASYQDALTAYKAGRWDAAQRGFDASAAGGVLPSSSLLYAARSLRAQGRCAEALVRFRKVVDGYPGSNDAANAALEGGECARADGDATAARALFEKAKESPATRARAESSIAALDAPKAKAAAPAATTLFPAKPAARPADVQTSPSH